MSWSHQSDRFSEVHSQKVVSVFLSLLILQPQCCMWCSHDKVKSDVGSGKEKSTSLRNY